MATLSKRSTVYLDPALHQALRIKSIEKEIRRRHIETDASRSNQTEVGRKHGN